MVRLSYPINPVYLLVLLGLTFCFSVSANPIPATPNDTVVTQHFSSFSQSMTIIIFPLIFIIDFILDLLILYGALVLLNQSNLLDMFEVFSFRTRRILLSALLVSIIGFVAEVLLGSWRVGLLVVLVMVFCSFSLVSYYLLYLDKKNALRVGFIAIVVNSITWLVLFNI